MLLVNHMICSCPGDRGCMETSKLLRQTLRSWLALSHLIGGYRQDCVSTISHANKPMLATDHALLTSHFLSGLLASSAASSQSHSGRPGIEAAATWKAWEQNCNSQADLQVCKVTDLPGVVQWAKPKTEWGARSPWRNLELLSWWGSQSMSFWKEKPWSRWNLKHGCNAKAKPE